ncbi:alpha/beta fold hydrolase [Petrachloros mirabilis]
MEPDQTSIRPFSVDADEYPFASRWFERNAARMHYVDEGTGPTILLLHGNPTWSYLYRNVIKALRSEARCIAPDYPGFGYSDHPTGYGYTPREHAQWVEALIDHLALERIILVCHDWGGPIGLSIATQRPHDFVGLVILNTWCWRPDLRSGIFSLVMGSTVPGRWLQLKHNFFAKTVVPNSIYHKDNVTAALRKAYTDPFPTIASRIGTWVFPREIRRSSDWLDETWGNLLRLRNKPAALVWALKDPAFGNPAYLARWQSALPQALVERVDDASHYLQEDRPDRIIGAIRYVFQRQAIGGTLPHVR